MLSIIMIQPSRNLVEIKFGGAIGDRQTAKLNSPPNFPAIRYILVVLCVCVCFVIPFCALFLYCFSLVLFLISQIVYYKYDCSCACLHKCTYIHMYISVNCMWCVPAEQGTRVGPRESQENTGTNAVSAFSSARVL